MNRLVYDVNDLAEMFEVAPVTIQRAVRKGAVPPTISFVGSRLLWLQHEIDDWVDRGCPPPDDEERRARLKDMKKRMKKRKKKSQ